MFTYFTVASSTTDLVASANTVFSTWGAGSLAELATIIIATLFGLFLLGYVIKHLHS